MSVTTARLVAGVCAALLEGAVPASAAGQALDVVITDPQDRVVPGAAIVVVCPAATYDLRSDREGRVALPHSADQPSCVLSVAHPGFTTVAEAVRGGAWPRRVQLRVAPVRQHVEINASPARGSNPTSAAASATFTAAELEVAGHNTADWLRYARAVAGTSGGDQIAVDGLATGVLPPTESIASITINLDPFSAEYATPNENHVEIATRTPHPSFRWGLSGSTLGLGGRNPLAPEADSSSRAASFGLSGRIPGVHVGFVGQAAWDAQARPVPIRAARVPGRQDQPDVASPRQRGGNVTAMFFYGDESGPRWRGSFYQSSSRVSHGGIGGMTLPDAAVDSALTRREARMTLHNATGRIRYRGGISFSSSYSTLAAPPREPAIRVLGSFTTGSPALSADESRRQSWTAKTVIAVGDVGRPLEIGGAVTQSRSQVEHRPNPFGTILFGSLPDYERALEGAPTGIRFMQDGPGRVQTDIRELNAFVQGYVVKRGRGFVRVGVRADAHSRDALRWSPRVYGSTERRRFTLSAGAGLFVRNWPPDLFEAVAMRDALHLRELVVPGASLIDAADPAVNPVASDLTLIMSAIQPELRRRRDAVARVSVARAIGHLDSQLEYTFTDGRYLPGSRRRPTDFGWIDMLESRERLKQHQFHARASYRMRRQTFTVHYEWTRSFDSGAGPRVIEMADYNAWARSADVVPWRAGAVAALRLPGAVSLSVVASAAGPAPYDITATSNASRSYLFTERDGRPRNSGAAAATRDVSVFGQRRLALPGQVTRLVGLRQINLGASVSNLFDRKHYLTYGSVLGTPLFGQPLEALAGRTIRLWVTL